MTVFVGVGSAGVLVPFPFTTGTIAGANAPYSFLVAGPDDEPYAIDPTVGKYLGVASALYDTNGVPIQVADPNNNAIRTVIVDGGSVQQFQLDSAGYTRGISGCIPAGFVVGIPTDVPSGAAGAARMSHEGVIQNTGPPREMSNQNTVTLQNTAEITVLPAGGAGIYNDLKFIHVSSTSDTVKTVVLFRDTQGGTTRFPIAIAKNGGSNCPIPYWNQTTPNRPWSVQLETSVGAERVFVNVKAEPRTDS